MLELLETKVNKKRDEIIPQQQIFLLHTSIEIDNNGYTKGHITINQNADIYSEITTFVNNKYVFSTKVNVKVDKLYIIGDTDFTGYNTLSTMAYIIGNTQPFTKKLSLEAKIELERVELKNDRILRIHIKKYGQTKLYINNEKTHDPVYGEDEITPIKTSKVIEIKELKQDTYNAVKVMKIFGNEESEVSETMIKLTLGLYTNAVLKTTEKALKRIIAINWKVLT